MRMVRTNQWKIRPLSIRLERVCYTHAVLVCVCMLARVLVHTRTTGFFTLMKGSARNVCTFFNVQWHFEEFSIHFFVVDKSPSPLVNVSRNTFFSSRSEKKKRKKHFLWCWHCGKKQIDVFYRGLHSYRQRLRVITLFSNIFLLFLHFEQVCKRFWKESLTRTSSSFA